MRGPGRARAALAVLVGVVTCACAQIAPVAAPTPDMPGCDQAGDFAFVGETTLDAIGLGAEFGGEDANRPGMVWVTAGPVSMEPGGRRPAGAMRRPEPVGRVVCIQWPDGSGMAGHISAEWQPPGGLQGPPVDSDGDTPTALLVVAAVAILVGVSFLAFRERRAA